MVAGPRLRVPHLYQGLRSGGTTSQNSELFSGFGVNSVKKPRNHEQRLLRNMGVHSVVLDLLQIPYDSKEDIRRVKRSMDYFCLILLMRLKELIRVALTDSQEMQETVHAKS